MKTKTKVSALNATQKKKSVSLFRSVQIVVPVIFLTLSSCGSMTEQDASRFINMGAHYWGAEKYGGSGWAESLKKTDAQIQSQYTNQ